MMIPLSHIMSFILDNELVLSFKDFVQDQNVPGTAIGFLLAQSTLDLSRVFVRDGIMPFVTAIRTTSVPKFDLDNIFGALITFIVTMLVIFTSVRVFRLQQRKVPIVATVSNAAL
jgi:large-conductance mechanosensitive channel